MVDRAPGPSRLRAAVNLLPALAFAATFGVFLVDKNREARTVLGSGRGLLAVAVLVGGYVAVGFALRRLVRWWWAPPVVLAAAVVALAAWAVRPYYVDETVDRRLVAGAVTDATTAPADPGASPSTTAPAGEAAAPVRLSSGAIIGIDHEASGTISLVRDVDGSIVVRFEQFAIEGVPDPVVYLAEGTDVREATGVDLGSLPGNVGEVLDIAVPDGVDAGPGWTVLVWCRAFAVPIANATQSAA